jgi:hypothetical protein
VWDSKALGTVNFVVEDVAFDVACSLGPPGVSATGVAHLLGRARRGEEPLGFPHWQIDLHDHALVMALDAFKDKLGRGKPSAREDLVRLAGDAGFSPAVLVARAVEARLTTMLALVADWVLTAGPAPAWRAVRDHLRGTPLRTTYMGQYAQGCARSAGDGGDARARCYLSALTRAVSDAPVRRALALALGGLGSAVYVARHGTLAAYAWRARTRPRPDGDRRPIKSARTPDDGSGGVRLASAPRS